MPGVGAQRELAVLAGVEGVLTGVPDAAVLVLRVVVVGLLRGVPRLVDVVVDDDAEDAVEHAVRRVTVTTSQGDRSFVLGRRTRLLGLQINPADFTTRINQPAWFPLKPGTRLSIRAQRTGLPPT